jgi:pyruvate dehydrogenase E1 component alpha subunit
LKEAHLAADEYFESAEKRIKNIVEECVQFTESSTEPPLEELYTDVYADEMNMRI